MKNHPVEIWLLTHPLQSIALVFLIVLLCRRLLGAILRALQETWQSILKLLLKIARVTLGKTFHAFHFPVPVESKVQSSGVQKRLNEIVNRLEALQKEQELLVNEMRSLSTFRS
jgi:hypothetical protein